jgi:hypothetical protein
MLVHTFDYRSPTRQAQAISVLDTLGKMDIGKTQPDTNDF